MTEMLIWELTPKKDDFAKLDPAFARTLVRCKTCLTYEIESLDDLPFAYAPREMVLSFVYDTDITLISAEFLKLLQKILPESGLYEIGKPATKSKIVAVRFAYRYQIRGTENIAYYLCSECGGESYVGFGKRYLVGPLDGIPPISESWPGRMLVADSIKAQLQSSGISGLNFEQITNRTAPADNLPLILKNERRR